MSGTFSIDSRFVLAYHRGIGRALRADAGGRVYHVLNRANARLKIFTKPGDYEAFETVLFQAQERFGTRLLSYCIMPNHWHRKTGRAFGLETTLRACGQSRKSVEKGS